MPAMMAHSAEPQSSLKRKATRDIGHSKKTPAKKAKTERFIASKDARAIATQTSDKAFSYGELDVNKFVKAREYEIRALEQGLVNSKKALSKRAFQLVPKELRRRTASHNAKRVPKRLRARARREMKEDNTPTVSARRRQLSSHKRLRAETARRLRALGKAARAELKVTTRPIVPNPRPARIKHAKLADAPLPKAKFRKRQKNKMWLPTHVYHAKRAHMTAPKEPLWRFAIPLTPTAKSYRPTYRTANHRGAIAFDMSYISTIMMRGRHDSLTGALRALDRDCSMSGMRELQRRRWSLGERVLELNLYHRDNLQTLIAPATVVWCPAVSESGHEQPLSTDTTSLLIRVHPAAFLELWEELLRVSRTVKPAVTVEDLRYEIGSIDVVGPAVSEALMTALTMCSENDDKEMSQLTQLTNVALLQPGITCNLEVQDPRLCQKKRIQKSQQARTKAHEAETASVSIFANWKPPPSSGTLFDRTKRMKAGSSLCSQKAIDRRKATATPGEDPDPLERDPRIPVLMHSSTSNNTRSNKWTILLPWKCVQPVWYALMYTPLSTGFQPRLGGLDEARQLALEDGNPWFPGDYPASQAGWNWEMRERNRLHSEWKRRPKSKRVNWQTLDLSAGQKGELGQGWACDWTVLFPQKEKQSNGSTEIEANTAMEHQRSDQAAGDTTEHQRSNEAEANTTGHQRSNTISADQQETASDGLNEPYWDKLAHMSKSRFQRSLTCQDNISHEHRSSLVQVQIQSIGKGTPQPCARIYSLPDAGELRQRWLSQNTQSARSHKRVDKPPSRPPQGAPSHIRQRHLAQSLLSQPQAGEPDYPACPDESHLIGFVTSGNYGLKSGQGNAIGSILMTAAVIGQQMPLQNLCIVRNSGSTIARLARWNLL